MSSSSVQQFQAKIEKAGINPCVNVPLSVSKAFGERGYVPVKGKLSGVPIKATLVPAGGGRHILYSNGECGKRRALVLVMIYILIWAPTVTRG